MVIEYHGWVALASSHQDWSYSDFDEGFCQVSSLLQRLSPEDGHDCIMPAGEVLPKVAYFKGADVASLAPVLDAVQEIVRIFDLAYGELVAFDNRGDQNASFAVALADRYRLEHGQIILIDRDREANKA